MLRLLRSSRFYRTFLVLTSKDRTRGANGFGQRLSKSQQKEKEGGGKLSKIGWAEGEDEEEEGLARFSFQLPLFFRETVSLFRSLVLASAFVPSS